MLISEIMKGGVNPKKKRGGKTDDIPQETRELIIEMRTSGVLERIVVAKTGVSRGSVQKIMARYRKENES